MRKLIFSIIAIAMGCHTVPAQDLVAESADSAKVAVPTIAEHIIASGLAVIEQPEALNEKLRHVASAQESASTGEKIVVGGYRIQMFSGNNARTAKNDADTRAAAVRESFPEYETYVTFDSPYWRLKVGDFQNYDDAAAALSMFKKAFPNIAREMRMVRDRINVNSNTVNE